MFDLTSVSPFPSAYRRADFVRARNELGFSSESVVLSCMPGSWREAGGPIAQLVTDAFGMLKQNAKHLVWIAGLDCELLSRKFADRKEIIIKKDDW